MKQTVRVASGVAATLVPAAVGAPTAPAQERGTLDRPLFMGERFQSGRSVHPVFEGWTPNPDPTVWVGMGNRSIDDMLQNHVILVYLEDEDYERMVADRRAQLGFANDNQ